MCAIVTEVVRVYVASWVALNEKQMKRILLSVMCSVIMTPNVLHTYNTRTSSMVCVCRLSDGEDCMTIETERITIKFQQTIIIFGAKTIRASVIQHIRYLHRTER